MFSLPDLSHLSQRVKALKLFRLHDLLALSNIRHKEEASQVGSLLRRLGTPNLPFEINLSTPVLFLLPPRCVRLLMFINTIQTNVFGSN